MWKSDVIEHYGSPAKTARALGLRSSAVSMWGLLVPKLRAYELQVKTDGAVQVDEELYGLPRQELERRHALKSLVILQ